MFEEGDNEPIFGIPDTNARWPYVISSEVNRNGLDDDGDGKKDCEDTQFKDSDNCLLHGGAAQPVEGLCDDGTDNDGDGWFDCNDADDCQNDPVCARWPADGLDSYNWQDVKGTDPWSTWEQRFFGPRPDASPVPVGSDPSGGAQRAGSTAGGASGQDATPFEGCSTTPQNVIHRTPKHKTPPSRMEV